MTEPQVIDTNNNVVEKPRSTGGVVKEIFGQFFTTSFWKELTKAAVQEIFAAAIKALGGTLYAYGSKRMDAKLQGPVVQNTASQSEVANRAFGGPASSYTSNAYNPAGSYPVQPRPDVGFPGFGNR